MEKIGFKPVLGYYSQVFSIQDSRGPLEQGRARSLRALESF